MRNSQRWLVLGLGLVLAMSLRAQTITTCIALGGGIVTCDSTSTGPRQSAFGQLAAGMALRQQAAPRPPRPPKAQNPNHARDLDEANWPRVREWLLAINDKQKTDGFAALELARIALSYFPHDTWLIDKRDELKRETKGWHRVQ